MSADDKARALAEKITKAMWSAHSWSEMEAAATPYAEAILAAEEREATARKEARDAALEEALKELETVRSCDCRRVGSWPYLPEGQEHWGNCTEAIYLRIRALRAKP